MDVFTQRNDLPLDPRLVTIGKDSFNNANCAVLKIGKGEGTIHVYIYNNGKKKDL